MTTLKAAIQAVEKVRWKHSFDLVQGKKFGPMEQSEETARAVVQALMNNVSEEMAKVGAYSGDFDDIICPDEEIERRMAVLIFKAMLTAALNEEDKT